MEKIIAGINVTVKETEEARVLEFTGSTEIIDRDGEILSADGWELKNYKKNPVILFAHDYRQPAVGKARRVWVQDGALKFDVEFASAEVYPFADTLYKLYKGGFMKATSVGFRAIEWKWGETPNEPRRTFMKQELLELSLVPVPANPEALTSAKELKSAWEKSIISEKEWSDFSEKINELFKKEIKPEDIEELQKQIMKLTNDFEAFKTSTDSEIVSLKELIKDKSYLDLLIPGARVNDSKETSLGKKIAEAFRKS